MSEIQDLEAKLCEFYKNFDNLGEYENISLKRLKEFDKLLYEFLRFRYIQKELQKYKYKLPST